MNAKSSGRKWLVTGLAVSLAINLFFIGVVAGRSLNGIKPPPGPGDPTLGYIRGLRNLPADKQAMIRPILRHHFRALRPTLRQIRPARHKVIEALKASPFDARKLEQALAHLRQVLGTTQAESHASLVEIASKLSATERRQLAEFISQAPQAPFATQPPPRPPLPE